MTDMQLRALAGTWLAISDAIGEEAALALARLDPIEDVTRRIGQMASLKFCAEALLKCLEAEKAPAISYEQFMLGVSRALCPICQAEMSDDGCDSNLVYQDQSGVLWEYYAGPWRYGHQTVACRNHHHFKVVDAKLAEHIDALDGASRGWVLHDFGLLKNKEQC